MEEREFMRMEREFMRMERKLKKIGPQGGRGWRTTGTTEDNLVMSDYLQKKGEMFGEFGNNTYLCSGLIIKY